MGVAWPVANDKLQVQLYDYDFLGDDLIASINLSLKQIVNDYSETEGYLWKQIYSAPKSASNDVANTMRKRPE